MSKLQTADIAQTYLRTAVMNLNDTIVAPATAIGHSATAMLRISGAEAIGIAAKHCGCFVVQTEANRSVFCRFRANGSVLDDVMVSVYRSPRSYTAEDVVEISFHGSPYIITRALESLIESGARLATPGEFTQRAYLNGKMDLSQAEGVADLIASESRAEHRLALHQMRGGFSKEINLLRDELIHFAGLIELELDFSEEDVEFVKRSELLSLINRIKNHIGNLLTSFRVGNAVKTGIPVAIIGKPNAGKSTLLNALLNEDRALVSDMPGTTRDAIEDTVIISGIKVRFIDTAGLRETQDEVEAMGVARSIEKMKSASIVIHLYDAREPETIIPDQLEKLESSAEVVVLHVANKSDLAKNAVIPKTHLLISAKSGDGLEALKSRLYDGFWKQDENNGDVIVTNVRHVEALKHCIAALDNCRVIMESGQSVELIAADIREALHHLGSITGAITTDELLANIFSRFCIGK